MNCFEGLLIGLGAGTSCLATCGPLVLSVIMRNSPSTGKSYIYLAKFMCGRLLAYTAIGCILMGISSIIKMPEAVGTYSLLLLGLLMLLNAFVKLPSYCLKGVGFKAKVRKAMPKLLLPTLGFVSALNICPSMIAVTGVTLNASSFIDGLLTFILFFAGSSLFMVPLPLVSLVNNKQAIATIGKFASIIVGTVLIVKWLFIIL